MKFINIRNSYAIERTLILCPEWFDEWWKKYWFPWFPCPIPEQPHSIPI